MMVKKQSAEEKSLMKEVEQDVMELRKTFRSGSTKSYVARQRMLTQFQRLMQEGRDELCAAMQHDLHKSHIEGLLAEVSLVENEIQEQIDHLHEWLKPESVGTDLLNIPGASRILKDPRGVTCIIGAWNYPILLSLMPLAGCLAAGNCALVRVPSCQYSIHSSETMARLIRTYLDPSVVRVVEGDRHATTAVLAQKFDLIFFTGGSYVGKMVAKAAAEHLTPTVLELGGKSPCIVDKTADLDTTAKRVTWGAFMNAGQTCVRPDYVMVHTSIADTFIAKVKSNIQTFYGENAQKSEFFGRVINSRAHQRLAHLLEEDGRFIVHGGRLDEADNFVEPTVLDFGTQLDAFEASAAMQDEIFGPIMPIFRYNDLSSVIHFINEREKPLALYCFTTNCSVHERVLKETSSGGAVINDCMVHLSNSNLPFGGVGNSGMGNYHGKASFDAFSHRKSTLYKTRYLDLPQRYPPYTPLSSAILKFVLQSRPRWQVRVVKFTMFLALLIAIKMALPPFPVLKTMLVNFTLRCLQ